MDKVEEFERAGSFAGSRILFRWLTDDAARAELYACLASKQRVLKFLSRADVKDPQELGDSQYRQEVYLLAAQSDVLRALTGHECFSNHPYRALGSGTFMLGLDPSKDQKQQHEFARAYLNYPEEIVVALANVAFKAAAVLPLKRRDFDLVSLAEQVAVRFVTFLFGFEQADGALIEESMRKAYIGLNYQIIGRHFETDPLILPEANRAMAVLVKRVAELLDLYGREIDAGKSSVVNPLDAEDADRVKRLNDELTELQLFTNRNSDECLLGFQPVLRRIAAQWGPKTYDYTTTEAAVIVVGLIAGMVGNIQASISIAIQELLDVAHFDEAREWAVKSWTAGPYHTDAKLQKRIRAALRCNPPAAFLPRRATKDVTIGKHTITKGSIVLLGMGGATRGLGSNATEEVADGLIFGGSDGANYAHHCLGEHIAMSVITHAVRQILALPGLALTTDPRTGAPRRLEKRWGVICERFPLQYSSSNVLVQSALKVIMKVKAPVTEHAEQLKKVIRYGAPRIEKKLRDSEHVHFAWFLFLENDTKLALFTVYDRDFDAYIEHFALEVGPLFDRIFEHIEDAPPMPVNEFPKEFVDTIRRYNASEVGGYLFSAYPSANVAAIVHDHPAEET